MKILDVKISYNCNNACIFCLNRDNRMKENDFKVIKKEVKKFAESGGDKLVISGGEPTIKQEKFFELLRWGKKHGIENFEIQTNGRAFYYEKMIKKIESFGKIGYLVSLHFPNRKLYKKFCNSDGFEQTVEGIRNLVKNDCSFSTSTVIMKPTLPYLDELVKLFVDLGVKSAGFRFIEGRNVSHNYEEFVPKFSEATPVIEEVIDKHKKLGVELREFPYCVLSEGNRRSVSWIGGGDRANLTPNDELQNTEEITNKKFSHPDCDGCKFKERCKGVRREYLNHYGSDEISPIKK